jgi:hypothetical protein
MLEEQPKSNGRSGAVLGEQKRKPHITTVAGWIQLIETGQIDLGPMR